MNRGWHNNIFNKRIWEEFPREFSLEDIDGVIRFHYLIDGNLKTRFILYEIKKVNEKIELPQLKTLFLLKKSINWEKFDEKSGIFIIKALDEFFNQSKILKLYDNKAVLFKDNVDFDYYKEWFYDNKNPIIHLKCPKCNCKEIKILESGFIECNHCGFFGEKELFIIKKENV